LAKSLASALLYSGEKCDSGRKKSLDPSYHSFEGCHKDVIHFGSDESDSTAEFVRAITDCALAQPCVNNDSSCQWAMAWRSLDPLHSRHLNRDRQ